jgi:hypothetical protein
VSPFGIEEILAVIVWSNRQAVAMLTAPNTPIDE